MSTFETARTGLMWDATSLPNAFICEYMPSAPEGYVKVYLYGLMLTHSGLAEDGDMLSEMSRALQMSQTEIEHALRYWERSRLVERIQDRPPRYRFTSVVLAQLGREQIPRDENFEAFGQSLYAIFGDRRKIHGSDIAMAYEWVEKEGLRPEIVLMLINHMISTHGVNFSFKTAQRVAVELCAKQVQTVEQAELIFSRSEAAMQGTRKVLNHLGITRNPSMDEIDLYVKWTVEWGFTPKAILEACRETTSSHTPTFAYLDKILEGLYERSNGRKLTDKQVQKSLLDENTLQSQIRDVLHAMGLTRAVIDEGVKAFYLSLLEKGDHAWVLLGAQMVGRRADPSLDSLQRMLDTWVDLQLTTVEAVNLYLAEVKQLNTELQTLMKKAGSESGRTQANRARLKQWKYEWKLPQALIELAAEYANGKKDVGAYMHKLLSDWHAQSIANVEEARASHERHLSGLSQKPSATVPAQKRVIEQQYEQRTYDPDDLNAIPPEQLEEMNKL